MLNNSYKQLDNCLKDVYESPLLTCVSKHRISHQELCVTTHLLWLLQFVRGHQNYSYKTRYISLGNHHIEAVAHFFDSSQNALHDQLSENSGR